MRTLIKVFGVICALLGGLWLLQGLGLVPTQPLFCAADCATVQGFSWPWVVAGIVVGAIGVLALRYSRRRR